MQQLKTNKSIIKKKKKKDHKLVSLAKTILYSIEVLTSKSPINWYISHDEFILINNVLTEYYDVKEEIKNLKTSTVYQGKILSYCLTCPENTCPPMGSLLT